MIQTPLSRTLNKSTILISSLSFLFFQTLTSAVLQWEQAWDLLKTLKSSNIHPSLRATCPNNKQLDNRTQFQETHYDTSKHANVIKSKRISHTSSFTATKLRNWDPTNPNPEHFTPESSPLRNPMQVQCLYFGAAFSTPTETAPLLDSPLSMNL